MVKSWVLRGHCRGHVDQLPGGRVNNSPHFASYWAILWVLIESAEKVRIGSDVGAGKSRFVEEVSSARD